jgi:hypothetical protein
VIKSPMFLPAPPLQRTAVADVVVGTPYSVTVRWARPAGQQDVFPVSGWAVWYRCTAGVACTSPESNGVTVFVPAGRSSTVLTFPKNGSTWQIRVLGYNMAGRGAESNTFSFVST